MPARSEEIVCPHVTWRLFKRGEVYYACGRRHQHGKHSLGTRDRKQAIQELINLDAALAEQHVPNEDSAIAQ